MLSRSALVAALGLLLLAGCDDSDDDAGPDRDPGVQEARAGANEPTPEETPAAEVDGDHPATAISGPSNASPRVPDWPSALDGLPDIDMGTRERAYMDLAGRLIQKGLEAMRAERYADATERFFEAVEVDPGSITARYNLACSLSREGDRQAAVALLNQLRDEGCGSCLGKVLKAKRDPDFDPIRKSKGFQMVVDGVEASMVEIDDAADEMREWLAGGKKVETPVLIDPRRKVTVKVTCPTCIDSKPDTGVVRGAKGLRTWLDRKLRILPSGVADATTYECKARCCTFDKPPAATATPDLLYPEEVCFRIESGLVSSLQKVTLTRFPIRTAVPDATLPTEGEP